jgi:tetratricopeptide (TPR) repeat protein
LLSNYQAEKALKEIESAIRLDSLSYIYHIQKSSILTHQAISENKSSNLTHSLLEEKNSDTQKASRIQYYHQGAIQSLNKAIELEPQNAYLYYNRGCTYTMMGDRISAIKDFDKAISLFPRFAEAHYNRAVIHLLNNEPEKAIPDLSKAGEMGLYKAYNLLKQATNSIETKKNEEKSKD